MEGETRAKLNFIEQLQQFHAQQGRPFTRLPQLDKAPIDLYKLAKAVANRGGPNEVGVRFYFIYLLNSSLKKLFFLSRNFFLSLSLLYLYIHMHIGV